MDASLICAIIDSRRDTPGLLRKVAGEPVIEYVLEAVKGVSPSKTVVIEIKASPETASPFMRLKNNLKDFKGEVLILPADTPLLRPETLKRLVETHRQGGAAATVLTGMLHDPTGYPRIIRANDRITRIIEEKDATIYEKAIEEVDGRAYCFDSALLFHLMEGIINEERAGWSVFTHSLGLMLKSRRKVLALMTEDRDEILRVISRRDLSSVNKILHRRIARFHMENGVTIIDSETTFIDKKVRIGKGSVIYPFTIIEGDTVIGEKCGIGPYAHLISAKFGDGVSFRHSVIKEKEVKDGKEIGPYKVMGA